MRFSQRHGYTPVRDTVQFESMDDQLRTSLWNAICTTYQTANHGGGKVFERWIFEELWRDFFHRPIDGLSATLNSEYNHVRNLFFRTSWYQVYDLVEVIASLLPRFSSIERFRDQINSCLERESSGYRFVGERITPITNQVELDEVDAALTREGGAVSAQLDRALQLLSDRQAPDYRNSVKESISAVEGQIKATLGTDKGTLGELLPVLERTQPMHPALREAFSRLYGYTSDEGGIRHALLDDSRTVPFEEAKFMVVACSAFVNYVRGVTKA